MNQVLNDELLAANQRKLDDALLNAKKRQRTIQAIMRLNVPYKVRLEAVALFGQKEGVHHA